MKYTHFVSVAALVLNRKGEILLIKSPKRGWEYPGGKVEPHETLLDALMREIREETGVDVEVTGFVGVSKNVEKDVVNIDFICKYLGGHLRTSSESTEVKWVSRQEAMELIRHPLTKKRFMNMLSGRRQADCFGFTKEPFCVIEEEILDVGMDGHIWL